MSDEPRFWEPWTPEVGDLVRIRLNGECPVHHAGVFVSNRIWNQRVGFVKMILPHTAKWDGHRFEIEVLFPGLDHTWFPMWHWVCAAELEDVVKTIGEEIAAGYGPSAGGWTK